MDKYRSEDLECVTKFSRAIYMDDVSFGAADDEETFELYVKSKQRLAEGDFNLRKFVTNSPTLKARIEKSEAGVVHKKPDTSGRMTVDDRLYAKIALESDSSAYTEGQKILRIYWNVNKDQFGFDLGSIAQAMDVPNSTKRDVVSITVKFF